MKRMPGLMALFFITIAIARVSDFLGAGLKMGWLGDVFAVGLAYCVYLSASFAAKRESRASGLTGVVLFGLADLVYNEFGLIYRLSPEKLIPPQSTFLSWNSEQLTLAMHAAALAFGACPSMFSATLGWMHSQGESVKDWNKPGLGSRFNAALSKIVFSAGGFIAIKFESLASEVAKVSGKKDENHGGYDWRLLSDEQRAGLVGKDVRQITSSYPGIPERTALNWYHRSNDGKLTEKSRT